jgi:hypothetical protein
LLFVSGSPNAEYSVGLDDIRLIKETLGMIVTVGLDKLIGRVRVLEAKLELHEEFRRKALILLSS